MVNLCFRTNNYSIRSILSLGCESESKTVINTVVVGWGSVWVSLVTAGWCETLPWPAAMIASRNFDKPQSSRSFDTTRSFVKFCYFKKKILKMLISLIVELKILKWNFTFIWKLIQQNLTLFSVWTNKRRNLDNTNED